MAAVAPVVAAREAEEAAVVLAAVATVAPARVAMEAAAVAVPAAVVAAVREAAAEAAVPVAVAAVAAIWHTFGCGMHLTRLKSTSRRPAVPRRCPRP
jgi:hypothetical protein